MRRSRAKETVMRIVVIGGTGVDTITGEGLAEVLKGASVVVDVSDEVHAELNLGSRQGNRRAHAPSHGLGPPPA
jgi:hypothetical protein